MAGLELYWFDLDAPAELACLSARERARAERFVVPGHGRRFAVAHAGLRWILARYLDCAPDMVVFEAGAHGKPAIAGMPLHFNLSHSGNLALIGVHAERELGVDVEAVQARRDGLGLARRFFTPREAEWLEALPEAERPRGFCRLWTCKEAWMKADGRGMALPLKGVEVAFGTQGAELRSLQPPPKGWWVRELELTSGFCAAVVQGEPPAAIRIEPLRLPAAARSSGWPGRG